MFEEYIPAYKTPFTAQSDSLNYYEHRVEGVHIRGDCTIMLAVLRALLDRRMGEDETLTFGVFSYDSYFPYSTWTQGLYNSLTLVETEDSFEKAEEKAKKMPGFEENEKIRRFFQRIGMRVACFIYPVSRRSVVIIDDILSAKHVHLLSMGIPSLLPWYFHGGITTDEKDMLLALNDDTPDKFLSALEKLYLDNNPPEEEGESKMDIWDKSAIVITVLWIITFVLCIVRVAT